MVELTTNNLLELKRLAEESITLRETNFVSEFHQIRALEEIVVASVDEIESLRAQLAKAEGLLKNLRDKDAAIYPNSRGDIQISIDAYFGGKK